MQKYKFNTIIQIGLACLLSGTVMAAPTPVDLTGWKANGAGTWTVQSGNDAVLQTQNNGSTMFFNQKDSQGLALSGEITVTSTGDDDFIGFVLGFNDGDLLNPSADYMLIDWKQGNQVWSGASGDAGLSISRVNGDLGTAYTTDAWGHTGKVTELQRATNLGSTGWLDNTTYSFDLIFTASLIQVKVDGVTELSLAGTFNNGSFGFYNYSQPSVLYAGIEEREAPPVSAVPIPAAAFMFAPALLGLMGLRRKVKNSAA